MKQKFLLLAALAGGGILGAQAQQLPNGGFENWKGNGNCGQTIQASTDLGGSTDKENPKKRPGDEPTEWNGTSIKQKVFTEVTQELIFKKNDAAHGNYASLINKYVGVGTFGANAPAYLTFGQPWSYAAMSNQDGGTVGGVAFTHKPDAIKGDFKRKLSSEKPNEEAHIIVYMWNGTFTSKIGKAGGDRKMITKDNVDRAVLGKSNAGEVTGDGKLIAQCDYAFSTTKNNDWETIIVPIEYKDEHATPSMMNVIISSADYWTRGNIGKENQLDVDNVEFIYYHALKSFTYDGVTKEIAEGQTEIDFSNTTYDANKALTYIKKGVGANVEVKTYNETDATLTIEVQGNDFAKNPNSKTTYTVQFAKPVSTTGKLSSLNVNGAEVLKADQFYYTVYGEYTDNSITWTAEDGDLAKVTSTYDANKRTATVEVNEGQNTYFVKFAKEGTNYASKVLISMAGGFVGAPAQNVEITPLTENKTIDLQLMNFSLDGGQSFIGDIFVENVPYATDAAGNIVLKKDLTDFKIFGDGAQGMINDYITALNLNGTLADNKLNATITITWMEQPIVVKVTPSDAASIDATGISGVNFEAVRDGLTNHNALIYADADATGAAANDIVDGTCANLTIADGNAFHALKPFTATQVSYDRAFKFGNNNYVSSFVLPFDMHTNDVDGKVYKFNAVNGDNVNFTEVTGQLGANTPYLIVASNANPFNRALANGVQIAATPETMEVTASNAPSFAHIGSYNTTKVTSGNGTTYYGYTGGKFVMAKKGTLNPFRTLIKATGTTATQFSLKLDGEVTGIIGVNTELGKVDVYNLEGKLVRSQVEAATALQGLEKGVYVINGKKVMK